MRSFACRSRGRDGLGEVRRSVSEDNVVFTEAEAPEGWLVEGGAISFCWSWKEVDAESGVVAGVGAGARAEAGAGARAGVRVGSGARAVAVAGALTGAGMGFAGFLGSYNKSVDVVITDREFLSLFLTTIMTSSPISAFKSAIFAARP